MTTARIALFRIAAGLAVVTPSTTVDHSMRTADEAEPSVVFSSDRSGVYQIYTMTSGGGDVRRLTATRDGERHPRVSRDGQWIAFESVGAEGSAICVMLGDGSERRQLTPFGGNGQPAWGPEGRIAFRSGRDGDSAIYLMEADGGRLKRLSKPDATDRWPAWSPDGRQIAYTALVDGDEEIFVMNSDGSGARRVTRRPGEDSRPSWSPDGRTIAFNSSPNGKHDQIFTMAADGGGARRVSGGAELKQEFMDRNVASWGPVYSPDGTKILFSSIRSGNAEIYVMDATGGSTRRLTSDPAQDTMASWMF